MDNYRLSVSPFLWRAVIEDGSSLVRGPTRCLAIDGEREDDIENLLLQNTGLLLLSSQQKRVKNFCAKLYEVNGKQINFKPQMTDEDWDELKTNFAITKASWQIKLLILFVLKIISIFLISQRRKAENPYPPFITSSLRRSITACFRPRRTNDVAQQL